MDIRCIKLKLEDVGYFIAQKVCQKELLLTATALGEIRVDIRSPERIRDIRPQPVDEAKANTLSSRYGLGKFPYHTDVAHWTRPARFVLMYCGCPGSGARPTFLQDSHRWNLRACDKRAILREVWKSGHVRPQLCTVGTMDGNRLVLRFDGASMTPMTGAASALRDKLIVQIEMAPVIEIEWSVGNMLILDNHRVLHARGASSCSDPDRVLKRILIGR